MRHIKQTAIILSLLLTLTFLFSACDTADNPPSDATTPDTQTVENATQDTPKNENTETTAEQIATIVNADWKDGKLVLTYSDGRIQELTIIPEETPEEESHMIFCPLPDDTYGVTGKNVETITELTIPGTYEGKTVSQILPNAFSGAKNLISLTVENGVTTIGSNAFNDCDKLITVKLAESVTDLGSLFWDCPIRAITISGNLLQDLPEKTEYLTVIGTTFKPDFIYAKHIKLLVISKSVNKIYSRDYYYMPNTTIDRVILEEIEGWSTFDVVDGTRVDVPLNSTDLADPETLKTYFFETYAARNWTRT